MSNPMLEVNSGTSVLSARTTAAMTHNAPSTAPERLPRPPITTMAMRRSESDEEVPLRRTEREVHRAEAHPEPGDEHRGRTISSSRR